MFIRDDNNHEKIKRKAPKEILYISRNIRLLPEDKIKEGFKVLSDLINQHVVEWPDLEKFKNYIINEWLNKTHLLSSFGSIIRTNNKSEAFNHSLLKRIGGPPPGWAIFSVSSVSNLLFDYL